jgi:putative FmdB family regulatory protein
MPLYYFDCGACGKKLRRILNPAEASALLCPCGAELSRDPRPPSSQVMETLDNGIMPKRLERLADAERLFAERAEVVKKQRGE